MLKTASQAACFGQSMVDLVGAMGCGDEKEKRFVGKLASTFARGRAEACSVRNADRLFLTDSTSIRKVWRLRIATCWCGAAAKLWRFAHCP
jgi:hypothetical protein